MPSTPRFATREIRNLFQEELESLKGAVQDTFDDGNRLFLRGVLKHFHPVGHGDDIQAGVALRAEEAEICVHPYVFRLICKNGAIWAHALETVQITDLIERPFTELAADLRAAIRSCASPSAFERATGEMRSAREHRADMAITMAPLLSELREPSSRHIVGQIMQEFAQQGDTSRFGMMNAITAVARETPDPDVRWRLEEFGGGVPVGRVVPILRGGEAKSLSEAYVSGRSALLEDAYAYTGEPLPELVGSRR